MGKWLTHAQAMPLAPRVGLGHAQARDHGRADGLAKLLTKVARESGLLWRLSGS